MSKIISLFKTLGPGLTYAAAAVGVSHLIQSTRAGAHYGLEFIFAIILIHLIKYPFFLFANNYSSQTGETLLQGYYKIGKWAVYLFLLITFLTMFTIQSAVTLVTANVTKVVFFSNGGIGSSLSVEELQCYLLFLCFALVLWGRYQFLDKAIKMIVIVLTLSTIIAVVFSLKKTNYFNNGYFGMFDFQWQPIHIAFLIAFLGWMPAPMDITVWYSEWNIAKQRETQLANQNSNSFFDPKKSYLDFHIGYIGTAFLAILFLMLGAFSLYGTGETFSTNSTLFVSQLIALYTENVGSTLGTIVKIAAFTTMLSTTLACLDAFIRVLVRGTSLLIPPLLSDFHPQQFQSNSLRLFLLKGFWAILLLSGTLLILFSFKNKLLLLIQIATIISFISSPLIAGLNYLLVSSSKTPEILKPTLKLKILSLIGILYFVIFSVYYLLTLLTKKI